MSKLKVGDRVAVYIADYRLTGTIKDIEHFYCCSVEIDEKCAGYHERMKRVEGQSLPLTVHPKQCRRLIKKPRRRIWVNWSTLQVWKHKPVSNVGDELYSEFVEVKKK